MDPRSAKQKRGLGSFPGSQGKIQMLGYRNAPILGFFRMEFPLFWFGASGVWWALGPSTSRDVFMESWQTQLCPWQSPGVRISCDYSLCGTPPPHPRIVGS